VEHLSRPSLNYYRELYDAVGRDWYWVDRLVMPDSELSAILGDPRVEVHLLKVGGRPAGYAELDRRIEEQIELAYFGLLPEYIGKGLGKYLLSWAVWKAWSYRPSRVWVHTCALDHPGALGLYQRGGFRIYDERFVDQAVLAGRPLPPGFAP
jgi:GNAT superfamily N-acetyltransferase